METTFREAGPADAAEIVRLIALVAAENMWIRTQVPFEVVAREERMTIALTAGTMVSFIAHVDAAPAGELTLIFREDRVALGMVIVAEHRRRGIGRALLLLAFAKVRERAVSRIDLAVYAHNHGAIELYRSQGFLECGPPTPEERADGQRWEAIPMSVELR
jgi:GNAT superfamily N-acetyltransferase